MKHPGLARFAGDEDSTKRAFRSLVERETFQRRMQSGGRVSARKERGVDAEKRGERQHPGAGSDVHEDLSAKGSARWPMQRDCGQCFIQVESAIAGRMRAMRRPGESYSSVILRLIELQTREPE
jgi:hypothetical protein